MRPVLQKPWKLQENTNAKNFPAHKMFSILQKKLIAMITYVFSLNRLFAHLVQR